MYTPTTTALTRGAWRQTVEVDGRPLTWRAILAGWRDDPALRTTFTEMLRAIPATAWRWETPAMTIDRLDDAFAAVIIADDHLARRPTPHVFAAHYGSAPVTTFTNLGGDSHLIAPCPVGDADFCHFASFLRAAPEASIHALWMAVGETMQVVLDRRPRWLSTAGGGVAWLHVRIDPRPKYYRYGRFRDPDYRVGG